MSSVQQQSNFAQLKAHDEQLERLGLLAERYFADDPNTCLLKLRQLAEGMAQSVASRVGIYTSADEKQIGLSRRLQDHGIAPREVGGLFHEIRKAGYDANHNLAGDHRTALTAMRLAWQLGIWFHSMFKDSAFKYSPFIPPLPLAREVTDHKAKAESLRQELLAFHAAHQGATQLLEAAQARVQQTEQECTLHHMLAYKPGTTPRTNAQRDWLKRIAAHTKANVLADRAALDNIDLTFKREGGGFNHLVKFFSGQLQRVLAAFNDAFRASEPKSAQHSFSIL